MKTINYIKNNLQKALFICFIALFIATFTSMLFPGYSIAMNPGNAADAQIKDVPIGQLFYHIGTGLGIIDNVKSYTIIESIFSVIFLCFYFGFTIAFIFIYITKKHVLPFSCSFLPALFIAVISINYQLKFYFATNNITNIEPITASSIFILIFSVIAISIDIARLVHYFKTHPRASRAPRQPRPRKPTSKERIAELEARVRELENKKDG